MTDLMSNITEEELISWVSSTDYTGGIGTTIKATVKDSEIVNFRGLCKKLSEFIRTHESNKSFRMQEDFKNSAVFWFVEEWEGMAAWKAYLTCKERENFGEAINAMLAEPPLRALYKINFQEEELMSWVSSTDYTGGIGVTLKVTIKNSEIVNFRGLWIKLSDFLGTQKGNKSFRMHEDFKNSAVFWLVVEWESMAAWKAFLACKEREEFYIAIKAIQAGPPFRAVYKINIQEEEVMSWVSSTDYTGGIGVTIKVTIKNSEIANFQGLWKKISDFLSTQKGNKSLRMHEDFKNSAEFLMVAEWESMAAWKTYQASKEREEFAQAMKSMMNGLPVRAVYKIKN